MADVEDVQAFALTLERAYEVFVCERRKFCVGSLVFVAFSADEETIAFSLPKEEWEELVASNPQIFVLPSESDLRFNWVRARLDRLDPVEAREFVWKTGGCACRRSCAGPGRGAPDGSR